MAFLTRRNGPELMLAAGGSPGSLPSLLSRAADGLVVARSTVGRKGSGRQTGARETAAVWSVQRRTVDA